MQGISQHLSSGEILKWDMKEETCVVMRYNQDGKEDTIAVFKNLKGKPEILPREGLNVVSPTCVTRIKGLFPECRKTLNQFGFKKRRPRDGG